MSLKVNYKLLIHSAKQVVQVVNNGQTIVKGTRMNHVALLEGTTLNGISIVVSSNGHIHDIGYDNEILEKYKDEEFKHKINAAGKCVLPGLVDAHTHPVWAGDRVNEFAMKLAGATYMDIHKAGGGIYYTVDHTRKASEDDLLRSFGLRLKEMLKSGTTLLEAKSGYGLDAENEIKMLRVINRAKELSPVEISPTFCGAHAVPRGMTSEEATNAILDFHLPSIKKIIDSGDITVDSIDVFCERGVFDIQQSRRILEAGREIGLRLNFHGDELHPLGSAEMGAELKAEAISHLEEISGNGIEAMAKSSSIAVILPTTAYMLKLTPPPVRKMIEAGVAVALGSDFNPNAFCLSMPLVMNFACIICKMTLPEALCAATINAAAALGRSQLHGSIEKGKIADLLIINANRWEHLIYQTASHNALIQYVIKKGDVVIENNAEALI